MKFLIPTAKEMRPSQPEQSLPLSAKSQSIIDLLVQYELDDLAKFYKIKPEATLIEQDRLRAIQAETAPAYPAIELFHGLMYRQLDEQVLLNHADFIRDKVFITSALYGIISASRFIQPHRLDFNCPLKLNGQSLKAFWREEYDRFFDQEPVVSLLSSEFETVFSKKVADRFIKIRFHEEKNGQLKTHSTISKKGRGLFLNQVIEKQVQELEQLKKLQFAGFAYAAQDSTDQELVFIKRV